MKKGFTIVEILIVFIILCILIAIVIPYIIGEKDNRPTTDQLSKPKSVFVVTEPKYVEGLGYDTVIENPEGTYQMHLLSVEKPQVIDHHILVLVYIPKDMRNSYYMLAPKNAATLPAL